MLGCTIVDEFINIARKYADNPCLIVDNCMYTYKEINELSNGFAKIISDSIQGIQKRILVFDDHPLQIACSIFGILKSRNVFIPVSNKTPLNRLNEIINDCEIDGYISIKKHTNIDITYIPLEYISMSDYSYCGDPEDDAYIIYTSGTTGKSKGVLVQHKGLINSVKERNKILQLDSFGNTINLMGYSFDGFLMSFFSPLITGASIYFPKDITDINEVSNIIKNSSITTFLCTPTYLKNLLYYVEDGLLDNVNLISLAGEHVNPSLVKKCVEKYPFIQLANEYGPTENSICTSINPDIRSIEIVSVGKTIGNVKAMIMNETKVCLQGQIGELLLSGVGVARGYVNDEKLTNERFVIINNQMWYRTGDFAYWNKDEIVIVGRRDNQRKINGYRVDLNEIEDVIMQYNGVEDCVVLYENMHFTAYIVSHVDISKECIFNHLRNNLVGYMIPNNIKLVTSIPMRESGKIDLEALKKRNDLFEDRINLNSCSIAISKIISRIFKEILCVEECDEDTNFFDVGGTSITVLILCLRIKDEFDVEVGLDTIRSNPTPILLAQKILNEKEQFNSNIIKPFNKFWFADCYFTSVLAVLDYYSIPLAPFIRSFRIVDMNLNGSYYFVYDYIKPLKDVFFDSGMTFDSGVFIDNFEEVIINHIIKKRVIMLHVDCYYLPYCKEKYKKEHFEHVITLTNYNSKKNMFDVIDQENLDSISFKIFKVDLICIKEAAYAAIIHRETFDNVDYVALYPISDQYENSRIMELDNSQYDYVIGKTIDYLRKRPDDTIQVIQRLINYLRIEKEVYLYLNENIRVEFFKTKEIQLMRYLMTIVNDNNNTSSTEGLIEIINQWEKF